MEAELGIAHAFPESVTDTREAVYRLTAMLGAGGQGAVFRTREGQVAVKLVHARESDTIALQARLTKLMGRPLWNWPISWPAAVLHETTTGTGNYNGFVMDLQEDVQPISVLIGPGRATDDIIGWYTSTGGLRRRLLILARAAETLAWLHGIPFVYADPSANNILIPNDPRRDSVWLIDPDNIGVAGGHSDARENGTPGPLTVFTEGYAAPEVISRDQTATVFSDRFAFAVLVFRVLTTLHPFVGDRVDDGDPADLSTHAYSGKLAYVDDPNDRSNVAERFITPRRHVLSPDMADLAEQTFVAGKLDPLARPGLARWATALREAAALTMTCHHCGATYFAKDDNDVLCVECPWCDTPRRGFAMMGVDLWVAPFEAAPGLAWQGGFVVSQPRILLGVVSEAGFTITRRIALAGSHDDPDDALLAVLYEPDGLMLVPSPDAIDRFWITTDRGLSPLRGSIRLPWRGSTHPRSIGPVHFGPTDADHRAAIFVDSPAR